ncbi:hypothetical protein ABBQ38_013232 [Trebouxia sp. C0009 RCD-2024]
MTSQERFVLEEQPETRVGAVKSYTTATEDFRGATTFRTRQSEKKDFTLRTIPPQ